MPEANLQGLSKPGSGTLVLSALAHTWLLDLDGTLVKHNGYKGGRDEWLPGALRFLRSIPERDAVIILTAREPEARAQTERFLADEGVRYDQLLFGMPMGERILVNDTKPSGLACAHAVQPERDRGLNDFRFEISSSL